MSAILMQVQLLLAALLALLPLVPAENRGRAAEILDIAGKALSLTGVAAVSFDELAKKLREVRAEVETMAAAGRAVSADDLDAAMTRVRAASAAFREALQTAEQGA